MSRLMPCLLFSLLLVTVGASPVSALTTLEEARCSCADAAANQGDYVSCMASFTRRLVLLGRLDRIERANEMADASNADLEGVLEGCRSDIAADGWGVGLQVGTAFYPVPVPGGVVSAAEVSLLLWNFSPEDVHQTTSAPPDGVCGYQLSILDQVGNIVRRDTTVCPPVISELDLPIGTVERRDILVPLTALQAETGLADGQPLPVGGYTIRVTWKSSGPNRDDMPSSGGVRPSASISIRVGS